MSKSVLETIAAFCGQMAQATGSAVQEITLEPRAFDSLLIEFPPLKYTGYGKPPFLKEDEIEINLPLGPIKIRKGTKRV